MIRELFGGSGARDAREPSRPRRFPLFVAWASLFVLASALAPAAPGPERASVGDQVSSNQQSATDLGAVAQTSAPASGPVETAPEPAGRRINLLIVFGAGLLLIFAVRILRGWIAEMKESPR